VRYSGGKLQYGFTSASGSVSHFVTANAPAAGVPHQLTVIWDGTNPSTGTLSVYLDGTALPSVTGTGAPTTQISNDVIGIGNDVHPSALTRGFVGTIANFTIATFAGPFTADLLSQLDATLPPLGPVSATEPISTTVTQQGALTLSVADTSPVVLPTPSLNSDASSLVSSGAINPVTVTDTRTSSPGWNVVGQASDFSNGTGGTIPAGDLGWVPTLIDQAAGQAIALGATVTPGSGGGLASPQQLASAPAGHANGTAHVGATLNLQAPTTTDLGTYTSTLTLTAI
jgi:hypothetical protein